LALHQAKRVELMVVNPRSACNFARALMKRSKTDPVDAATLLEYVKRMPFTEWTAPSEQVMELQRITRHSQANVRSRIQELNRMHALRRVPGSEVVQVEVSSHIEFLDQSTRRLRDRALEIVASDPRLAEMLRHATSVKGIAVMSGLALVAELAALPDDMTPRQWVAHAGLDPRLVESGTSVDRPVKISKAGNVHLRCALYMPALVAIQHEPSVRAFYQELVGRGKKPMVAVVAVMRKLLHALHGMLHKKADFDGAKFHALAA
jgi:transposase